MHSELIRAAYDEVAILYAQLIQATQAESDLDLAMIQELVKFLPPEAKVLDVGCGAGRMIAYLNSLAPLVVEGCDISPSMVELAQATYPHQGIVVADLRSLPFDDAAFQGLLA